jgi:hypothetical protein
VFCPNRDTTEETMTRLETVAKDLAVKLKAASPKQQRVAGLAACRLALQRAPVDDPVVTESLSQLQQVGVLSLTLIEALNDLTEQLDTRYFDLQDKAEEAGDDPDMRAESLRLFSQARSVAALSFAGGEDSLIAAMEAIYEASATSDDDNKFFDEVLKVLS